LWQVSRDQQNLVFDRVQIRKHSIHLAMSDCFVPPVPAVQGESCKDARHNGHPPEKAARLGCCGQAHENSPKAVFVSASHSRPKLQRAGSAIKADPETALLACVDEMRPGSAHFENRHC
jgi:hypothetical protein